MLGVKLIHVSERATGDIPHHILDMHNHASVIITIPAYDIQS